jgi:Flp pilus assembly pilin Flp
MKKAMKRILGILSDEQGIETLEWIAVAFMVVTMAIFLYPGAIQTALSGVVSEIASKLTAL